MIGRAQEVKALNRLYDKKQPQLVAVYGRRRVGKTYLIDQTFSGRITFRHAGLSPSDESSGNQLRTQLEHFYHSLVLQGMEEGKKPESWLDAFFMLEKYLQNKDTGSRQLVFLDELPWMDTPKSGFIQAFEAFWNSWGCQRSNLMVIICGSANSWILNKMINNHGGLYGRLTYQIKLEPFTLHECEKFYISNDIRMSRYDMVQSYMIFGGIPYYMGYLDSELSLAQNIDQLFFARNAVLKYEYDQLFASVFTNPEAIKSIVQLLYTRNMGYTRKEIVEKLGISDGGTLSKNLNALIASDFIVKYAPFGLGKREQYYKLTDPFCLFSLHFLHGPVKTNERFWEQNITSQPIAIWRGYAFENVCFHHIDQIKAALGISGVITSTSAWSKRADDVSGAAGTQIDLLILRNDNVVNMCEIKFYNTDFSVDRNYYRLLLKRQQLLADQLSRRTAIHSTLITTFGLVHNDYSGIFTNVVTLDDLFE